MTMSKVYLEECPCKKCNNREVGCHNKCTLYLEWTKNSIEVKNEEIIRIIDFSKRKRLK